MTAVATASRPAKSVRLGVRRRVLELVVVRTVDVKAACGHVNLPVRFL